MGKKKALQFPVFLKLPDKFYPSNSPIFYIIARNGLFIHKENNWVKAVVPVKQISVLDNEKEQIDVKLPPLPQIVLEQALLFFRKIYEIYQTEAIVLLHYNFDANEWRLSVPEQSVSSGFIAHYDAAERVEGFTCVGTIHSHGDLGAFHSGVDRHDEINWDGIHITIGSLREPQLFSFDAEVVVNGTRKPLPLSWFSGLMSAEPEKVTSSTGLLTERFQWVTSFWRYGVQQLYRIERPELAGWSVPDGWIRQVQTSFSAVSHRHRPKFHIDLGQAEKAKEGTP